MNPHFDKLEYKIFKYLLTSEDSNLQVQSAVNFSIQGNRRCQQMKCEVCKRQSINTSESKIKKLISVETKNGSLPHVNSDSTASQSHNNIQQNSTKPPSFTIVKDKLEKDILGLIEDSIKKDLTWDKYKNSLLNALEKDSISDIASTMKFGYIIKNIFKDDKNDDTISSASLSSHKRRRYKNKKVVTECPHPNRKHYAKRKCYNCYHKEGRVKKAWVCEHSTKPHYAHGLCHNCYQNNHIEMKTKKKNNTFSSDSA